MFFSSCILAFIALPAIPAAFTAPTSYGTDQLVQLDSGIFCYKPLGRYAFNMSCRLDSPAGNFAAILRVHLGHPYGLSIAYYDMRHNLIGGATWKLPSPLLEPIYLCMSGVGYDASLRSVCRFAIVDNDFDHPGANAAYCAVDTVSPLVQDGCYDPPVGAPTFPPIAFCGDDESATEVSIAGSILSTVTSVIGSSGFWMLVSCALLYWSKQVRALGARVGSWISRLVVFLGNRAGQAYAACFAGASVLPIHAPALSSALPVSSSAAVPPATTKVVSILPPAPEFASRRAFRK